MKVLVLGAAGMLGHKLVQQLKVDFDVAATIRQSKEYYSDISIFQQVKLIEEVNAENFDSISSAIDYFNPDVVLNCIGVVKQLKEVNSPIHTITINALLPHKIREICLKIGCRFIQFSTDCVFSGKKGYYTEEDQPDPVDLYGKTKLLGEVSGANNLTVRTSILGHELSRHTSLIDWFLSQRGNKIKGFDKAIYNGLTTLALSQIVKDILINHRDLQGLYHISSDPISKYELLKMVNHTYSSNVTIDRDVNFLCDRSLDNTRFRAKTGIITVSWEDMIKDMKNDLTDYPAKRDL